MNEKLFEGWAHLSQNEERKHEKFLTKIISEFMLRSLAFDVSQLSPGFPHQLGLDSSARASSYIERFEEKLQTEVKFYKRAEDLEQFVSSLPEKPWASQDTFFAVATTSNEHLNKYITKTDEVNNICKYRNTLNEKEFVKQRYFEVDSIFRHFRNALAHGCIRIVTDAGSQKLFFFDTNPADKLSAIGLLTFQQLGDWIALNNGVAMNVIDQLLDDNI